MSGKYAKPSFLRLIGSRALVHVERHISKLEEKAWEGVLVCYDSDSPTYRIFNRQTDGLVSPINVNFIEQAARHISTDAQATWGRNDGDEDDIFELPNDEQDADNYDFSDDVYDGITQLENASTNRTTPMQLRSTGGLDQDTSKPLNERQARELRKLAINSVERYQHAHRILDSVTQYVGVVGIKDVVPPASILVPTT